MAKKEKEVEQKKEEFVCLSCGKNRTLGWFYQSQSNLYEYIKLIPVCKDCVEQIFNSYKERYKKDDIAMYFFCRKLDLPYVPSAFEGAVRHAKKTGWKIYASYLKQVNSFGDANVHSGFFDDTDIEVELDIIKKAMGKKIRERILSGDEEVYSKDWRGTYKVKDIEYLDEYYNELRRDFKIVTKNHKDYARKIAKASLAMDSAYDDMMQGVAGADKKYKELKSVFDDMSKSAQFAEDKRGQNDVSLGCYGVTFEKVEQDEWIPQHTPIKKDDYDNIIDHFSTILKSV